MLCANGPIAIHGSDIAMERLRDPASGSGRAVRDPCNISRRMDIKQIQRVFESAWTSSFPERVGGCVADDARHEPDRRVPTQLLDLFVVGRHGNLLLRKVNE